MTEDILEINCLGLKCPLPVIRMEKALRQGHAHFCIIADDPVSVIDIPLAAHRLNVTVQTESRSKGIYIFEISPAVA